MNTMSSMKVFAKFFIVISVLFTASNLKAYNAFNNTDVDMYYFPGENSTPTELQEFGAEIYKPSPAFPENADDLFIALPGYTSGGDSGLKICSFSTDSTGKVNSNIENNLYNTDVGPNLQCAIYYDGNIIVKGAYTFLYNVPGVDATLTATNSTSNNNYSQVYSLSSSNSDGMQLYGNLKYIVHYKPTSEEICNFITDSSGIVSTDNITNYTNSKNLICAVAELNGNYVGMNVQYNSN